MSRVRVVLLGVLLLAACLAVPAVSQAAPDEAEHDEAEPDQAGTEAVELTVMSFNIWVGGTNVDFGQVSAAVEAAGADIVGVQESNDNLARIAQDLGWDHVHEPMQIISRYPIIVPEGVSDYVYVEVTPGKVVGVSNVHLQAYPYGPYDLRDGASRDEVLANEQTHMDEMASRFNSLPALADAGVPVFLTGDFNVPSHLDWTAATGDATPRPIDDGGLTWPVSNRLAELGFRDSFREAHSDPVATPAYTWTPGYPPPSMEDNEVHDRIDFVYAGGPSSTTGSRIIGEPPPADPLPGDFGGPHADVVVDPWPSDHRAVASTFEATPVAPPADPPGPHATVSTSKSSYAQGEPITVNFADAPGASTDWLGVYEASETPDGDPESLRWTYIDGETSGERTLDESSQGSTWPLPPGDYSVHLLPADGYQILATANLSVTA